MPVYKLKNGGTAVGTMLRIVRTPAAALIAKQAGLDFIMLDMEHGAYSLETVADVFTTSRAVGVGAFVRVPELSRDTVSRALDCGAQGVMVPMIESVEQAEAFVSWAKYPPLGGRGLGSSGGHTDYGHFDDAAAFMEQANRETLTIAQIESVSGVGAVGSIAAIDGIDALLVGPMDLSVSLGCPGDLANPRLQEAIGVIADAAENSGKILGMHAGETLLEAWISRGLRLVMNSLDTNMLSSGMSSVSGWFGKIQSDMR